MKSTEHSIIVTLLAAIALHLVVVLPAQSGKNANGALIVHTNDAVSYTTTGNYCGVSFDHPGTCEQAGTRTDKAEDEPAVIWFLAAFPDTSSPAVTVVYFGIDHNLPSEEGYFQAWGFCAPSHSLEVPDPGWPEQPEAAGNSVASPTAWPVQAGNLFPFYWFAAYGFEGAYLGTAINPTGGYASFVDDSNPGVMDEVARFGTVRWGADGSNDCPDGVGAPEEPDFPEDLPDGADETPEDQTPSFLLPSTDTRPFHKVDIYADKADTSGFVWNHWSSWGYPTFLRNASLLVVRDYQDTVAVCNSFANDHVLLQWRNNEPAEVRFTVDPPRLATSLYLLNMVDLATPGDGGDPIGLVTLTDENAHTLTDTLSIGSDLRCTWKHDCEADLYSQHPSNPLCGEVWSDVHVYGDSAYYDVQEIALPTDWRSRRITEIALSQHVQHDYCCRHDCVGGILQTRLVLSGASLGTEFHIVTAGGDSIVGQRQDSTAWATHAYGGRRYNGETVGTWRTIGDLGCFLTCVSMSSNYYGVACDPDTLNRSAQENSWYDQTLLAVVDTVYGQGIGATVDFTVTDNWRAAYTASDRLVLRHPNGRQYDPVAIIRPVPPYTGDHRSGVIDRRFACADSVIGRGDHLECYGFLSDWAAMFGGGSYRLHSIAASDSGAVTRIEEAMANDYPLLVHTFVDSVAVHWVVADGMGTHWDAGGPNHRGTYRIHDPGSERAELVAAPYLNRIAHAKVARRVNPLQEEERRLVIIRAGNGVLGIIDPLGRMLRWNAEISGYETDIAELVITPGFSLASLGDSVPSAVVDRAEISDPVEGDYVIQVNGTGDGTFTLNVGAHDGPDGYRTRGVFSEGGEGDGCYLLSYVANADSTLGFRRLDPAGVGDRGQPRPRVRLLVSPNPAARACDIELELATAGHVTVTVFDVAGRSIATIVDSVLPVGIQRLRWDGRTRWGAAAPSGIYFVHLRGPGMKESSRLVYIR